MSNYDTKSLDVDVRVFPAQNPESNLLANANVTIGGCFAIKGVHVVDSDKGPFVSMPQWKDKDGEYHDVCFPTTKEMREALHDAVLDEYAKTTERNFSRASDAMERRGSIREKLQEKTAEVKPPAKAPTRVPRRDAR